MGAIEERRFRPGAVDVIHKNRSSACPKRGSRRGKATGKSQLSAYNLSIDITPRVIADGTPNTITEHFHSARQQVWPVLQTYQSWGLRCGGGWCCGGAQHGDPVRTRRDAPVEVCIVRILVGGGCWSKVIVNTVTGSEAEWVWTIVVTKSPRSSAIVTGCYTRAPEIWRILAPSTGIRQHITAIASWHRSFVGERKWGAIKCCSGRHSLRKCCSGCGCPLKNVRPHIKCERGGSHSFDGNDDFSRSRRRGDNECLDGRRRFVSKLKIEWPRLRRRCRRVNSNR